MADKTHTSYAASTALDQYTPCKLSSGKWVAVAANTDQCIGVVQDSATADNVTDEKAITGKVSGYTKVIVDGASSAIAKGDELMCAAGKLVKFATGAGRIPVGRADEASSADGDIIGVFMYANQRAI